MCTIQSFGLATACVSVTVAEPDVVRVSVVNVFVPPPPIAHQVVVFPSN